MPDINDILLAEITGLRKDVNEVFREHGGRISSLESKMQDLIGDNGRVTALEQDFRWHETKDWIRAAVIVPVAAALSTIARHLTR